ncbi:nitroreductase [Streptomyces sp. NPDC050211]|uniref:nitroreductase n=1 Tax=Streptomyces sp. NPDC050211 TaxID=3154932 RepID=UPI00343F7F73
MPEQLEDFRAEFGIPGEYDPIGAITVGYRADDLPTQSPRVGERRRGSGEVIHRGYWGRYA